jgi:putative intracellular protease/amidase
MTDSASRRDLLRVGVAALALAVPGAVLGQAKKRYVCPPCGCPRDRETFEKPGTCPACGMPLVEEGAAAAPAHAMPAATVRAAVLIFGGVQVIDFAAPYEVFGQAGYEVFTVAAEPGPILTSMGLQVAPRHVFADAPRAEVVLVPGGEVAAAQKDARVLEWLRGQAPHATHVVSVCNGAFILAAAGLLDGLRATTFYDLIGALRSEAPRTQVVSDRRFVDNGKVITTAGLSSGIDGALHVVSRISGPGRAQMAALNMEYDWKSDGGYARASFADAPIRRLFGRGLVLPLPAPERAEVSSTAGDVDRWEVVWSVPTARPREAVSRGIAAAIEERGEWTRSGAGSADRVSWTLAHDGSRFRALLAASPAEAAVRVSLGVERY